MKASAYRDRPQSPRYCLEGLRTAEHCIGEMKPGERLIGLTKGQFSLLDIVRAVLQQTGPAHVRVTTWSAGIRDAENAAWLIEQGDILSLRMLVDRSFPTRQPKYARRIVELFGARALHCTRVHAKFCTIRNEHWNVCIRSSMDLNRNSRFEQFDLDDSPDICDFFDAFVDELAVTHPEGFDWDGSELQAAFAAAMKGSDDKSSEAKRSDDSWFASLDF